MRLVKAVRPKWWSQFLILLLIVFKFKCRRRRPASKKCAIHRGGGGGGGGGGGLYWLVELGPIDRNHACKHTERSFEIWEQCCGRWEGSYGVWIVELIYSWIRYSVGGHVWFMVQTIEAAIVLVQS